MIYSSCSEETEEQTFEMVVGEFFLKFVNCPTPYAMAIAAEEYLI